MIYINVNLNNAIYFYDKNGWHHRLNGPAYINSDNKSWWKNGALHRLDGPAFENENGQYQEWWIKGIEYDEHIYYNKIKEMGLG
jgi:hypothetical protein